VTVQAEILDLLQTIRRDLNLAVILISHDLGVVAQVADRVAVMYAGRIIEEGPAAAVLSSPLHPYTEGLLGSMPGTRPGARLEAIPGLVPDLAALPEGCAFAPRCSRRFAPCETIRPERILLQDGRAVRCLLHGGTD